MLIHQTLYLFFEVNDSKIRAKVPIILYLYIILAQQLIYLFYSIIINIMGSCVSQAKQRSLSKTWEKKNDSFPRLLSQQSTLKDEKALQRQIEQTAQQLFDKFNSNKNGVLEKHELINFLRYAIKRSGYKPKKTVMIEIELQMLLKKAKIPEGRDYLTKSQFMEYIKQSDFREMD